MASTHSVKDCGKSWEGKANTMPSAKGNTKINKEQLDEARD
jgi:hypothetical protein